MLVREFDERDLPVVVELSLRAWAPVFVSIQGVLAGSGVYERLYPGDWRDAQRQAVTDTCRGGPAWVADVDGVVAGFVAARLDHQRRMGEVTMLAVDPDHQRRGIGSGLTEFALAWLRDNGMTVAMVETGGDPGHAPARRTYERAGFTLLPVARYFTAL